MKLYSPSTGSFYAPEFTYAAIPGDVIQIEDDYHASLIAGQAAGQMIVAGQDGVPVLADRPAPSLDEVRALMSLTRQQLLTGMMLDGLITPAEAVAAAKAGDVPAAVETIMAAMPEPQQSAARIKFAAFASADRLDPMVALFAAAASPPLTDVQIDDFFTRHAAL